PAVRRISGARTPRVESLAGDWLRQDYEVHRHSAAEPGMPEPPILAKAEAAPKVGPPVVLANAKATVGAIPAQVFEALTDAAPFAQARPGRLERGVVDGHRVVEGLPRGGADRFDDDGFSLTHADAQGREPAIRPPLHRCAPSHLMDQRAHDPGSRASERMA